jgi:hypothetical protein
MSKVILELQKWCKGNSILIVSITGSLLRLYTPFRVECLEDVDGLLAGKNYIVDRVMLSSDYLLSYEIQGRPYYFKHFHILGK